MYIHVSSDYNIMASTVFKKSSFQKTSHFIALGSKSDAGCQVIGIVIAHLGAFGSGEQKNVRKGAMC